MFVRLAEQPDPADPEIAHFTIEPQASRIVSVIGDVQRQKLSQRGPVFGSISNVSVSADRATVTTCLDLSARQSYRANGEPRPGSRGGAHDLYILTLNRVGSDWKVSNQSSPDGSSCNVKRS
jgi:hypothetical protein